MCVLRVLSHIQSFIFVKLWLKKKKNVMYLFRVNKGPNALGGFKKHHEHHTSINLDFKTSKMYNDG